MSQQAADARSLLDHLGIERAHVVGHSYGGAIALQLALDAPERVASLALLEPAGIAVPSGEVFMQEVLAPAGERYARGDKAGAVELFLQGVCGPQMREVADRVLPPGAYDLAVADADTFFLTEGPALGEWQFGPDEGACIEQPVLLMLGADSDAVTPMFGEMNAALAEWLPRAESVTLPGATHALQMMNPDGTAALLADLLRPVPGSNCRGLNGQGGQRERDNRSVRHAMASGLREHAPFFNSLSCSTTRAAADRFDFSIFDGSRPEMRKFDAIRHN